MPELPEVETIITTLRPRLVGRTIHEVRLHRSDILLPVGIDLPAQLTGRRVTAIDRRGKRIIFQIETGSRFYIHLGMTGRLTIEPADIPLEAHTHLELLITPEESVRFRDPRRFGGIWWLGDTALPDAGMGPEPLTLRPAQLARQLAGTTRAIKSALLDQSVVAGLGNIYVDESLFLAGIDPLSRACDLSGSQVAKLNRSIKAILNRALRHRGSTLRDYRDSDGMVGGFQKLHRVYDREGKPCRVCRRPIVRIVLGGRSTHFCPACQKRQ